MLKNMKPNNRYMIINVDEPYAEDIYTLLKARQWERGEWPEGDISFAEWIEKTFEASDET